MIPVDADIVKLTRLVKLSESGDGYNSYFYVNDRKSTLAEFDYLLSSARISAEGYNLVQQGDVTRIVEMSTLDRRRILDDISGISKFDEEIFKADVEKRSAEENIDRIAIILGRAGQADQAAGAGERRGPQVPRDEGPARPGQVPHGLQEEGRGGSGDHGGSDEQIDAYSREIESPARCARPNWRPRSGPSRSCQKKEKELQAKGGQEFQELKERIDALRVDVARASDLRERSAEQMTEVSGRA